MGFLKSLILVAILSMNLSALNVNVEYIQGSGVVESGYIVGPSQLKVNGLLFEAFCYDISRSVSPGNTWVANVYNIPDMNLGDGFFDVPLNYQKEAYLATLYGQVSTSQWGSIQFAAWNLMNSSAPDISGQTTYLNLAATQGQSFNANNWYALEDVNGVKQSFLVRNIVNTPEPKSFALMGIGLIALGLFSKKK